MTGAAFLGACLLCGETGEVVNALSYEAKPDATMQVRIRLDSSQRPAVETREYPARYIRITRCKDRRACDARVAAYEAAERARGQAGTTPALVEPMDRVAVPAVDGGPLPEEPEASTWFD